MADPKREGSGHQAGWAERPHEEAQAGNIDEHATTVREALMNHRWAVMWSLTVSMSVIMEETTNGTATYPGYDTILMGNFLGFPAFQKQFGEDHGGEAGYQVTAAWHFADGILPESALWGGSIAGCIIGVFINGYLISQFGFKRVFLASLLLMTAFIFPSFFGKTPAVQTVGQVLCGVPWGIFATIGPAYASEILPLALRSYLTAYVNMCFAIGQFIGAGVIQGLLKRNDEWSYRIPFAVQWVWPVPLFVICLFMPESPWWLVQKGRLEEAEQVLRRVTCGPQRDKAPQTLAMMVHTNAIEHEIEAGSSYLDCFRGSHRRRTEIACVSFAGQVLAGSQFAYSGTYFFQQAGMGAEDAYKLGLGGTAIAFVGTILSWFLMRRVGRRTIYLSGMSGIVAYLFTIGILTTSSPQHRRRLGAILALPRLALHLLALGGAHGLDDPGRGVVDAAAGQDHLPRAQRVLPDAALGQHPGALHGEPDELGLARVHGLLLVWLGGADALLDLFSARRDQGSDFRGARPHVRGRGADAPVRDVPCGRLRRRLGC
ncbi:general substrate transporter [Apiospora hydei]|uniref:General substrate transporter n=1 Tax=Apiospora hydei TaxID=1337664 RepID=A0ABR1VL38_9PEZI